MAQLINPEIGRVYRRNNTRQGGPEIYFDLGRNHTFRVEHVTDFLVIGTIVSGDNFSAGAPFNPPRSHFTDKYFDPVPL